MVTNNKSGLIIPVSVKKCKKKQINVARFVFVIAKMKVAIVNLNKFYLLWEKIYCLAEPPRFVSMTKLIGG